MDKAIKAALPQLAERSARLMLLAFAAAATLHVDRAPLWCTATVAINILAYWFNRDRRFAVSRWIRMPLTVILLGGVLLSFGTLNGPAAGSALLLAMGGLKLLETRTHRDAVVVTTVSLILVLAAALDRQDLLRLPLYLCTGWLALATIASLGSYRAEQSAWLAARRAGAAMLLALPFAVIAFVLVPRLPGALWSMPGSEKAQTGLGEEMSPGSISDLAVSDAIAFRVRFEGEAPPPAGRYWRGPVLHDFDGNTWRNQRGRAAPMRQDVEYLGGRVAYQVTLEPHNRQWLFALDTAQSLRGRRAFQDADGLFNAFQPVTSTLVYESVSYLRVRHPGTLSTLGRRRDTRLPEGRNPRTLALARSLRAQAGDDAGYAALVMRYFATNGFEYTLTPPRLDYNSVDDLIFNTRLGFCGHFASAYVTLMRAAGIPSRVVTGYLGGALNPVGDYYLVRQSDAHAWAEVWLEGQGWVRFDPTGMVAPERLQRGLRDLLPGTRSATDNLLQQSGWLRFLRDSWDATGSWWRERVVNFNRAGQRQLLASMGLENIDYRGMGMLLLAGAALWAVAVLAALRLRGRPARRDPLQRLWERYLALLARRGLAVAGHEGPEGVRRRAQRAWPEASGLIGEFTRGYERLRFGAPAAAGMDAAMGILRTQLRAIARATAARRRQQTAAAAPE
jgi:transglutaminase-like putative cysteine protease